MEWYLPAKNPDGTYNKAETNKRDDQVTNLFNTNLEQNTGLPLYAPYSGGFGLEANWKGLSLQMDFSYIAGKHLFQNDLFFAENPKANGLTIVQHPRVLDYWKQKGQVSEFPSMDYMNAVGDIVMQMDDHLLEDASFLRMKNLTLGYSLQPKTLAKQKVFSNARVYFSARNLFTISDFYGPDPEVDGIASFGINPNTRQFTVGLELGF